VKERPNAILAFPTAAMLLVAFWLYVTRNRKNVILNKCHPEQMSS
jgi:hypothetical protein